MRRTPKPLVIAACLSLLSLQLSGLHVHADENGYIGVLETPFTPSRAHHEHHNPHDGDHAGAAHADDYDDARDISLLDIALGIFKMPLAILSLVLLFAVFPIIRTFASAEICYPVLSGRYTRWRPPLRAPPRSA